MSARRARPRAGRRALVVAVVVATAAGCSDDGGDRGEPSATERSVVDTDPPVTSAAAGTLEGGTQPPASGTTEPAVAGEPGLVFGFVAPGPGLLNDLSIGQERGLRLAVDDVNAAGGVLGAPVGWLAATEAADRTVDDVVTELEAGGDGVFLGTVGSDSAAALQDAVAARGSLACSASATRPSLTEPAGAPSFVRTAIRDDVLATFVAEKVVAAAPPPARVAIVGRDDAYGTDLAAALTAELGARGAETVVVSYPSRRVALAEEGRQVAAAGADVVVAIALAEAPRLAAALVDAGVPAGTIVGLDGFAVPRVAEQAFPDDPPRLDGMTVIATTGDRAFTARLAAVPAAQDQDSYGAQMYDCVIALAVAATAAGSLDPAAIAAQVGAVTGPGGRTCSNVADCLDLLAAGEDVDLDGATGGIAIDADGDVTTARLTTSRLADGVLQEIAAEDVDLEALGRVQVYESALLTAQVQQILRLLGLSDGEVTGIWDEATTEGVLELQRQLGVPETGEWDDATDDAFRARYGDLTAGLATSIEALQQGLADLGLYAGPVDGRWSEELSASLRAFQRQLGVPETGVVDLATLRALYAAGVTEGQATTTTVAVPTTAAAPTTAAVPATTATVPTPPPPPTVAPPATPSPPASTDPPPPSTAPLPDPDAGTLFDVVDGDPRFTTLVDLLRSVGYDTDLARPGTFTVFAPTDEAFERLPPGTVDDLRGDAEAVGTALAYHVVEGTIRSTDLAPGPLRTVHGADVTIGVDDVRVTVDDAEVVDADVPASNGVIHAIDAVLVPPPG